MSENARLIVCVNFSKLHIHIDCSIPLPLSCQFNIIQIRFDYYYQLPLLLFMSYGRLLTLQHQWKWKKCFAPPSFWLCGMVRGRLQTLSYHVAPLASRRSWCYQLQSETIFCKTKNFREWKFFQRFVNVSPSGLKWTTDC